MRQVVCDRCGTAGEIPKGSTWPDKWGVRESKDLCPECFNQCETFYAEITEERDEKLSAYLEKK